MDTIAELRAREDEVAREWEWLHEAINLVARAKAEDETDNAFRLLQHQAMIVGQRRVELRLRMVALEASNANSREHAAIGPAKAARLG